MTKRAVGVTNTLHIRKTEFQAEILSIPHQVPINYLDVVCAIACLCQRISIPSYAGTCFQYFSHYEHGKERGIWVLTESALATGI